jgi:hypothetical protein
MLFRTGKELMEYIPYNTSDSLTRIKPDLHRAEIQYIKTYLGNQLYNNLVTAYSSLTSTQTIDDLQPPYKALAPYVQRALANLAATSNTIVALLDISQTGIKISKEEGAATPWQWQIEDLKAKFYDDGFWALENLLEFLEENVTDYADWKTSPAYTLNKKRFINSAGDFNIYYTISDNRMTFFALLPIIDRVEELIIKPNITPALYNELKTAIAENALNSDEEALIDFIKPAVACHTISRALTELQLQVSANGILVKLYKAMNNNSRENVKATDNAIANAKTEAYNNGEAWVKKLRAYLDENASATKYVSYYNSTLYQAPGGGSGHININDNTDNTTYAFL